MGKIHVTTKINGDKTEYLCEPYDTMLDVLRNNLNLTGSKEVCSSGDCGACSITLNDRLVCSCLMLAAQVRNSDIVTIEGVANKDEFKDLRQALKKHHALQCGYCTPGFFITIISLLNEKVNYSETDIRKKLSGNICRCTGYTGIILAVSEVIKKRYTKEIS